MQKSDTTSCLEADLYRKPHPEESLIKDKYCTEKLISVPIVGGRPVVIHASGVLRVRILIRRCASVIFRKKFLDFPAARLNSHRELEIFLGDVIPELNAFS
jgi:hypothetical protein